MSDTFRSTTNKGQIIKSPVDIVIGTKRLFGQQNAPLKHIMNLMKSFGQDLMDPPDVKGWPGGKRWITTHTMALRTKCLYQGSRGLRRDISNMAGQSSKSDMTKKSP